MGWLKDLWHKITDWLREQMSKILGWIVEKIEDFTVWLKVTRHKFANWLADFVETDTGFWLTLGGVAVSVLGIAFAIKAGWMDKIVLFLKNIWEQIKSKTGSILEVLHYSEIYSIDKIAKILIPEYGKLWNAFYKAMGSLAEEIGLGVGTITAFLRNANNLIISTYTAIGYTPDESEVIYMTESSKFFSKVDGRFERYTRDPEYIFRDINEEIVKPHLYAQGETSYKLARKLDSLSSSVEDTDKNIENMENDMKQLLIDLPTEMSLIIRKRTDIFFRTIDDFRDKYITPNIEKINAIKKEVSEYKRVQTIQRNNWKTIIYKPSNLIGTSELMDDEQRENERQRLLALINNLQGNDLSEILRQSKLLSENEIKELYDKNKPSKKVKKEYVIQDRFKVSKKIIESNINSWFVGEF